MTIALPELPVLDALPPLRSALAQGCAVLSAPPGSGKTTVVPLALLDQPWLAGQRIVMLEPRRVAARAAAARMAQLLGESVGETVGYQVRFERKVSARTRIEVVTEGLLARRLQADPELPGVGLLIFDEFHERSLDADLALALALDARANLRPELRVLVMSATLDIARVAALLGQAPIVESGGKLFDVEIRHVAPRADLDHGSAVGHAVIQALQQTESDGAGGDILAFLPGAREIRNAQALLNERLTSRVAVAPLYGELGPREQDAALLPDAGGRRKVILATNIAQTSLTVEGVRTVVDGGLVRVAHFDLGAGANRLDTERVSRASADQRAGRAGRLGPGVCYRLWSREQHATLAMHDTPEILAADLTRLALELAAWGATEPSMLALLDAPPQSAWTYARDLLRELDALDADGRISDHGRALVRLPAPPRRAHMLLRAQEHGLGALAAWVAAVLDERDSGGADLVDAVERYLRGRGEPAAQRRVRESARQMLRLLGADAEAVPPPDRLSATDVARIAAWGYPERIARRRPGMRDARDVTFQCADGGEASLPQSDSLSAREWLAIAHWSVDSAGAGRRNARRIRFAAALDGAQLLRDHPPTVDTRVHWDARTEAVVAERQSRIGALVVERRPLPTVQGGGLAAAMCEGVRTMGLSALPWTEAARQLQARVMSLRHWRGNQDWPDLGDDTLLAQLESWLPPHLDGVTRRDHLSRLDLATILRQQLDYPQQQLLDRLAPTHLEVPTGSRIRLEYRPPEPPILAVKLQEMFGCAQTPAVNDGRLPVVLHLLSPAQRPVAVTQDLAGFWARSYGDVRKDLRGRYPRHPWPDDPVAAAPTRRAKPRGT
jgi:ATP-dependent helicase HrpB